MTNTDRTVREPLPHQTFYLYCWDEASRRLDLVKSGDYAGAYRAAYSGLWSGQARNNSIYAAQVDGASAALATWVQVQGVNVRPLG